MLISCLTAFVNRFYVRLSVVFPKGDAKVTAHALLKSQCDESTIALETLSSNSVHFQLYFPFAFIIFHPQCSFDSPLVFPPLQS